MATPTKFPATLQRADGAVAQVNDLNSYNAGVAQGYFYPSAATTGPSKASPLHVITAGTPITPSTVITQPGGVTTTIKPVSLSTEQDDGR